MTGVILIFLVVALAAGLAVQYRTLDSVKRNASDLADSLRLAQDRVKQMEQELGALCSASVGAGDHLMRLEQQVRRINERQNVLEMRPVGDRPYAQASELVDLNSARMVGVMWGEDDRFALVEARTLPLFDITAKVLLVAGAYVAYYGYYELRLFHFDGPVAGQAHAHPRVVENGSGHRVGLLALRRHHTGLLKPEMRKFS